MRKSLHMWKKSCTFAAGNQRNIIMRKLLLILTLFCATTLSAQEIALDSVAISGEAAPDSLIISEDTTLAPATSDCLKLDRISGTYFLGDDPLTRKEYRDFLRVNAPDLYNRYRTGNALWWTGLACFGVGTSVAVFGGLALFRSAMAGIADAFLFIFGGWYTGESIGYPYDKYLPLGAWCFYGGSLLAMASAPLIAIGAKYKFTINSRYNERCERQQTTLELSLQTNQNGIGFALRF